jgi:hypothetical protein
LKNANLFPDNIDTLLLAVKPTMKTIARISKEVVALETAKATHINTEDMGVLKSLKMDLDDDTKQISHALPFLMQIYESIFKNANKYSGKTMVDGRRIPNKDIMRFAANKINEIERNHAHPQLFDKLYYIWDLFNLDTALHLLESYLDQMDQLRPSKVVPGQIITTIEKSLANAPDFASWDNDLSLKKKYRTRMRIVDPPEPTSEYLNNNLMLLTSTKPSNPVISTISQAIQFDQETGILNPLAKVIPSI